MNSNPINFSNAFKGNNSYKIGLVFLIGYLLTYFSKMKENNVNKVSAFVLLFMVAFLCSFMV